MNPQHWTKRFRPDTASDEPLETRGARRLEPFEWPLARMQAELAAIDPALFQPLPRGWGWSQIQLIEPDGRGGSQRHPSLAHCPAMLALAESFGAKVMGLTLARLDPGGGVHEHRDISGGLSMGVLRLHVPLQTDRAVDFRVEGIRVTMAEGETWQLDTTYPHKVNNTGDRERVHLILDLEATPALRALLPKPDLRDHLHRAEFAAVCASKGVELALTSPRELGQRVARFARLRLLGQSVMTFDDPADTKPPPPSAPDCDEDPIPPPQAAELGQACPAVPAFFACPECRSSALTPVDDLRPRPELGTSTTHGARCQACQREFPYVAGVWVLWSDELAGLIAAGSIDPHATPHSDDAGAHARAVKRANVEIYQQVSEAYGEHADASVDYVDQILLLKAHARELLGTNRPGVLVDVGCATGFALDVGSSGFTTRVGVDISLENLRRVAARGHHAILADAERLPFADGSVDLLTCFAAMHHFPNCGAFVTETGRALRPGGVFLSAHDPSANNMYRGLLARAAWDLRKPVYRHLARFSERFYLHADTHTQALNDLAEHHRTGGGFTPEQLRAMLTRAGLARVEIFLGVDRRGRQRYGKPSWQEFVLKSLSGRNPVLRRHFVSLSSLSRKPT